MLAPLPPPPPPLPLPTLTPPTPPHPPSARRPGPRRSPSPPLATRSRVTAAGPWRARDSCRRPALHRPGPGPSCAKRAARDIRCAGAHLNAVAGPGRLGNLRRLGLTVTRTRSCCPGLCKRRHWPVTLRAMRVRRAQLSCAIWARMTRILVNGAAGGPKRRAGAHAGPAGTPSRRRRRLAVTGTSTAALRRTRKWLGRWPRRPGPAAAAACR